MRWPNAASAWWCPSARFSLPKVGARVVLRCISARPSNRLINQLSCALGDVDGLSRYLHVHHFLGRTGQVLSMNSALDASFANRKLSIDVDLDLQVLGLRFVTPLLALQLDCRCSFVGTFRLVVEAVRIPRPATPRTEQARQGRSLER